MVIKKINNMLLISRVNEFPNTVNISPGSRIIFPNTKEYILNNHNEWVPIHMMAFEIKNDLVSEDLNSIENFGIYHQNNTSNAKLTKNYPSESAGVLKVYKSNDFVYQEYTVLSGQINENKTYVRSKYVGVWSNWVAPTYISDSEWNTIKNNSHSHSNKTLLDSLNNAQVNNWNKAYSWDNHATQGYIKISDTDTKYVPFIGDSKIKGSLIIQNKETYNNFLPGAFTLALNFNKVTLNDFGIYQNLDNEVNPNYWIGYKDNNNIEKKFVEFNLNQNKFTLGKSAPIYIDTFQLSSINQVSYLTLDNSGKIGKIDGLPLSNFTETDPTVPSFVKAISNQQILNWNNITENYKNYIDDRIIEPNSISTNKLQFGFTSWDNNNSNPYADFLHFGGYQDATGGNQNLILFNKNNFGLRQYQKTSQSTEPYISFVDYWNTNNFKQVDINNWNEAHSWGNHAGLYASVAHSHTIENIKNLQATLDGKVDLVSAQTITGVKNFQNGFDINSYQFRGLNSNVLTIGKNVFGNSLSKIVDSSIAVGNNVFPSMNLQPFDPVTESWNNKGYVGIGSDIFIDYTGDSNYRPDHNAHDSWIGLGRGLGAGFLDGTNVTLVGTGLLGKNDVKYADSITILGKGFTNGRKTRGTKTLDPNRIVLSKNGYNVHGMMSDVIGIGHENWIEDINQSVVIGSNLRPYSYVFNSLVLGHHHLNMNFEGTTEQADMYLDSDIIMGMGVGKRSSRHAPSHNLLIGMDYFYSTGGAPNANYRPLIEGRFKDGAQLQVNGTIIGGFEKIDDDLPYLERITFESVSLPSGVVYNASERSFTFDGTQASTSINLHNIPANPNRYVYIEISSSNHIAGSWGYSVYNAVDSGNGPTDNFVARETFKTTSPTTFILTTEGNFKGTLHITLDYTDITTRSINPNILLKDSKERDTFEIRTTQDPSILSMGLNSGKFLTHGGKTLILGKDILSETPAATDNVLVGNNIFKFGSNVRNNVVLGNGIGGNNTNIAHSVVISNNTLQSNFTNNVARLTIVGHGAGKALTEGVRNNLFGESAGVYLTKGSNNSFLGSGSGLIKEGSNNTFIGHTAGGYGLMQSTVNNTIVIGANAAPEVPNNTTTIATAANTDNFLYGTTHSNAFKVRGGTSSQFLKADGTLDSNAYMTSVPTATSTVLGSVKLFSDTKQSVAANTISSTASRTYGVQVNAAGQLVVNVPWVDNNTAYTHPDSGVTSGTYRSVTVNAQGHVTAGTNPTTLAGYGITDAYIKTEVDTNIKTAVDNIQIGGRNILLKSNLINNPASIPPSSPFNQYWIEGATSEIKNNILSDTYYTITLWYIPKNENGSKDFESIVLGKKGVNNDAWDLRFYYSDPSTIISKDGIFTKCSLTLKAPVGSYILNNNGAIGIITFPDNKGIDLYKSKLEKGNKATDWTPAPEDQISDWNTTDANDFSFIKNKPKTFPATAHTHTINEVTGLQNELNSKEPTFTKNTAFNKNFGTIAGTVAQGNHTHSFASITDKPATYPPDEHTHSQYLTQETDPTVPSHVKSISTVNINNWNTAYTNNHTHSNKAFLDGITTSANVDINTSRLIVNPSNLSTATYGSNGGFVQTAVAGSTNETPIDGMWVNKIKILHNNSDGYFTELAQSFTGNAGLWHRRNIGGATEAWTKILDSNNGVTLDTTQTITGRKTFRDSVSFDNGAIFDGGINIQVNYYGDEVGLIDSIDEHALVVKLSDYYNAFGVSCGTNPSDGFARSKINLNYGIDATPSATHKLNVGGNVMASGFVKSGGTATQVLMADGSVKEQSTFGGSGSNNFLQSNPQLTYGADGLNYFNAANIAGNNPAINQAPTNAWHHIIRMNHNNGNGYYADLAISMTDNSGISRRVISNGAALSDWVKLWDSSNFNPDGKANVFENAIGIGLSSGQNPNADNTYFPYFYSTYGHIALATRKWVADNYIPKSHPVYNITQANINSWNEAHTWGNHATQGYLKDIPTASTNVLGGIKIGYGLTINNQIVDVDAVKYKGNTPALTGNTKNVNGITLSGVYNNGYPTLYGNVLNLQGNGGGQLLAGWNGDATTGALYYRSLRDNNDNWSDWREIAYTNWVSGNFMGKSGVQTVNNDFNISNNGVGFKLDANSYPTLYYGNNELKISDDNILSFTGDADFNGNISATNGNSNQWNKAYSWGNHSTQGYLKALPYKEYADRRTFTGSFLNDTFGTEAPDSNFRLLRTQSTAPSQLLGNFSSGIAFKGADTQGTLMVAYDTARARIAGGNGTGLNWAADLVLTEGNSVKNGSLEVKDLIIGDAYGAPAGLFRGTADNADFTGANVDLKTWYGLGIIDSSSGNRNIVFNARNGNILTKGIVASEGYSKRGLSDDYLLTANGGATHKQTFLNLDSNGNAINLNQDTDFNTITKTGFYRCDTGTNAPSGKSWYHIMIESHENGGGWCKQTATAYSTGSIESGITFTRVNVGGSWQPWKRLITDTDNAGINLLVASKNWSKNWGNNGATIDSIVYNGFAVSKATSAWGYFYQSYNFEVGKTYTLSVYVMCPNNNAINCGLYLFDNWSLDFGAVPSSWKRVSKTFTVTPAMVGGSTNRNVRVESGSSSVANPLYLAGMKLEESNFPSPWSMHPTDIVDTYSPQTIDGNKTFTDTTYFPKARIQTDGNIVTDSFGNAFQWNQAYTWGNHATAGYLKSDSALVAGFINGDQGQPYIRHNNNNVIKISTMDWVSNNFVDKWNAQTIDAEKLFTTILKVGNDWSTTRGLHFRLGNADNATIEGCNGDISSWWGIGLGHHYTGNYVRTIAIDVRSGSITANAFVKSGGTATQVLMANGSVKEQSDFGGSYTLPTATTSVLGGIKLSSDTVQTVASNTTTATAGRTYASQVNANGQLVVNVPWTDNNTTYGAGSNLTLTGTTFAVNSSPTFSGSVTAGSFKKSGGTSTQILMADGSVKEQSTVGGSNYTAGSNISLTGNTISVVDSPTFNGAVTAPAFYESSLRSLKTNIQPFEKSGLDLIKELDIVTFDRKDETAKNKIGIIADDSPKEFLSEELDAVDLYKTVFIQAKAIQELKSEVDELKELVKQLLK